MRNLKFLVIITWLILTGILISRDLFIPELSPQELTLLKNSREENYYGIWLQKKRIGYVTEKITPAGNNNFQLQQNAFLNLTVLNTTQPITMELQADLDNNLHLNNFDFKFHSPFYAMKAKGTVKNKTVNFTLDTGRTIISDQLELPRPPLLEMNNRGYLLQELPAVGNKVKISSFDPISLSAKDITIKYLGKEKILIRGRVYNLHSFVKTFSGIRIKFWLNEQGKVIKEKSISVSTQMISMILYILIFLMLVKIMSLMLAEINTF